MKFVVSSTEINTRLLAVSKVIPNKPSLPILENLLFCIKDNSLTITASDLESTMRATMPIENVIEDGSVVIPYKILADSLKDFPEQPITFNWPQDATVIEITWSTGKFQVPAFPAMDFPEFKDLDSEATSFTLSAPVLLEGINRCLYATGEEELRPVMNGIFFDLKEDQLTMVASDAHKLVCYTRKDFLCEHEAGFILPKKPANILKALLNKLDDSISFNFDNKNIYIYFGEYQMLSRLVEGTYPAYRSVIPKNNTNKAILNRLELMNSVRRVAVCSNQGSNLVKLKFNSNELFISAQDTEFHISAYERIVCNYEGDELEIGFKAPFLVEILSNMPSEDVCIALADASRAGLIVPTEQKDESESILALIMPMMINA